MKRKTAKEILMINMILLLGNIPEMLQYLVNLLQHTSGHDSFMRYMAEINSASLEKYILSVNGNQKLTHKEIMYIKIYCNGFVGLACEWILGQINTTMEEIVAAF